MPPLKGRGDHQIFMYANVMKASSSFILEIRCQGTNNFILNASQTAISIPKKKKLCLSVPTLNNTLKMCPPHLLFMHASSTLWRIENNDFQRVFPKLTPRCQYTFRAVPDTDIFVWVKIAVKNR
jgi:hypothetical protein